MNVLCLFALSKEPRTEIFITFASSFFELFTKKDIFINEKVNEVKFFIYA